LGKTWHLGKTKDLNNKEEQQDHKNQRNNKIAMTKRNRRP